MIDETQTNTLRVCDELRAYARENNLTYAKFSLRVGKSHTWMSEVCRGRTGAHLGVLETLDIIDWPVDLIEWANRRKGDMKRIWAEASRSRAKCPVAAEAHWFHGVRLYPIAAQPWR